MCAIPIQTIHLRHNLILYLLIHYWGKPYCKYYEVQRKYYNVHWQILYILSDTSMGTIECRDIYTLQKYSMSIKHGPLYFTPLTNFEGSINTFHSLCCTFVIILHNAVIVHGSCTAKTDLLKMKQYIPSLFYFTGHDLASWWDGTCTYRIMPAWFLGCGYKSIENYVILSLKPYLN